MIDWFWTLIEYNLTLPSRKKALAKKHYQNYKFFTRPDPAYTNNEVNLIKITKDILDFPLLWGVEDKHSRIDDLLIYPPNIILDYFCLLAILYSWDMLLGVFMENVDCFFAHFLDF